MYIVYLSLSFPTPPMMYKREANIVAQINYSWTHVFYTRKFFIARHDTNKVLFWLISFFFILNNYRCIFFYLLKNLWSIYFFFFIIIIVRMYKYGTLLIIIFLDIENGIFYMLLHIIPSVSRDTRFVMHLLPYVLPLLG